LVCFRSLAQNYTVRLHFSDKDTLLSGQLLEKSRAFTRSADAAQFISGLVPDLQKEGYLGASVDSFSISGKDYDVYVFFGKRYRWARLDFTAVPEAVLLQSGIHKESWE